MAAAKTPKPPVTVVLHTSRLLDPATERNAARGRLALVSETHFYKLRKAGHAAKATEDDIKAASHPVVDLTKR